MTIIQKTDAQHTWNAQKAIRQHPLAAWLAGVALFVLVVVLSLVASTLNGPLDPRRTGTLGEWVSGLGSVCAVFAAVGGLLYEVRSRRSDEELKEAMKVYSYAQLMTVDKTQKPIVRECNNGSEVRRLFLVRLKNDSAAPIYHPKVRFRARTNDQWADDTITFDLGSGCLVPGDLATPGVAGDESSIHYAEVATDLRHIELQLVYRSSVGTWWRIWPDGLIERASHESGPWIVARDSRAK